MISILRAFRSAARIMTPETPAPHERKRARSWVYALMLSGALLLPGLASHAQDELQCNPGFHKGGCHLSGGEPVGCKCIKDPPPAPSFVSGSLFPHYQLITILYSVPGEASEVVYGSGMLNGAKTENKASFKQGLVVDVETNVAEFHGEWAVTQSQGGSLEIKKEISNTLSVGGTGLDINHDKDEFFLWTNAEIDINQTGPNTYKQTMRTQGGQPMVVIPVTAAELKDPSFPSSLPEPKKTALAKLTDSDRAQILSADPFIGGGGPSLLRFVKVDTLQLTGPDNPNDPQVGQGLEVTSEVTKGKTGGSELTIGSTVEFGGDVDVVSIKLKVMAGFEWEVTYETTSENTEGTTQKAEVMLKTGVVQGYEVVDVYEDTLLNSLAFTVFKFPASAATLIGTITDAGGKPVSNQLVTVALADGTKRRVFTNAQGVYRLFEAPQGAAQIQIGNVASQVTLSGTQQARDVQLK